MPQGQRCPQDSAYSSQEKVTVFEKDQKSHTPGDRQEHTQTAQKMSPKPMDSQTSCKSQEHGQEDQN